MGWVSRTWPPRWSATCCSTQTASSSSFPSRASRRYRSRPSRSDLGCSPAASVSCSATTTVRGQHFLALPSESSNNNHRPYGTARFHKVTRYWRQIRHRGCDESPTGGRGIDRGGGGHRRTCRGGTRSRIGRRAEQIDVANADSIRRAVDAAVGQLGRLEILCDDVRTSSQCPLAHWDPMEWDRILRIELIGIFSTLRAVTQ